MKKSLTILLWMIISLSLISCLNLVYAEIRINEIELNPAGTDTAEEWIELYSSNEINLSGWKLINNDDDEIELNQIFNGYLIIEFNGLWLDNSDEKLFLYNNETLIDETDLFDDSNNNDKTWQYCSGEWNFITMTKNSENNCEEDNPNNEENEDDDTPEISISIEWDEDDIINGEVFDIEIIAENLDKNENYDVKVWIESEDNNDKISQTYDENDKWVSSNQYYDDFFEEEINKTKDISLRIHENYDDYYDDGIIHLRIRKAGSSNYIKEIDEGIEILEPEEVEDVEEVVEKVLEETEKVITDYSVPLITEKVIKLGGSKISQDSEINEESEDIKTPGNMIYQSKTESIKKYAIFGFALLCVGLSVLIIFKKL